MDPKLHAKRLEAGFKAFREGVLKSRGLYEIIGDVVRAADGVMDRDVAKSLKDERETFGG